MEVRDIVEGTSDEDSSGAARDKVECDSPSAVELEAAGCGSWRLLLRHRAPRIACVKERRVMVKLSCGGQAREAFELLL